MKWHNIVPVAGLIFVSLILFAYDVPVDPVDIAPFARPDKLQPAYTPLSVHNTGYIIAYLATVAVLVIALLFAVRAKELERTLKSQK